MAQPWYTYNMDSPGGTYGKIKDPVCRGSPNCYLKPDVNICVPGGVPITALWSGIVSNVNPGAPWGQSVTLSIDNPPNSIATHQAYNYMGNIAVSQNQRVQAGQVVGYSRGGSGICTAFALTNDARYGNGTFSQYNGDPRLNPYPFLLAFRAGKALPIIGDTGGGAGGITGGGASSSSDILTWLQNNVFSIFREIGIFLLALMLIVAGILLLAGKQIEETVKTGAKGAMFA